MTARAILIERRNKARNEAEKRTSEVRLLSKDYARLENEIKEAYAQLLQNGMQESGIARLKEIKRQQAEIVAGLGFPKGYTEADFLCKKCDDTGYVKFDKCECLKRLEAAAALDAANLSETLLSYTFESFDLSFNASLEPVFSYCREYADAFAAQSANLFCFGGTGLGKTHLAAAITKKAAEKGHFVVFESAYQIMNNYKMVSFDEPDKTAKYTECALLVIDDFGAEVVSAKTIPAMTELINRRIFEARPTIITTNLDLPDVGKIYGKRLFSRILGEYKALKFTGKDARMRIK